MENKMPNKDPFVTADALQYKKMIGPAGTPAPGGGNVGQYNKVVDAKTALELANAKFPSPPASLTPGSGHGVGVAFAASHGADHTGTTPPPATGLLGEAQGIATKQANVDQYMKATQ